MRRAAYYPDARPGEWLDAPVLCALFRHSQGVALFDTGCHPDAATDGEGRWGEEAKHVRPTFRPEDAVISQLSFAGVTADDVDLVICSHLHFDHCGCNVFFRRATVICQALELTEARAENAEAKGFLRREWDVGLTLDAVDGEHDVFGDGCLTLIPFPGHTLGSMGAHAVLDRTGAFLLASDAAPVEASLAYDTVPRSTRDAALYLESLAKIRRFADDGAQVIFGHDDAQWRRVRTGQAYYD